jgi:hypothetical protein
MREYAVAPIHTSGVALRHVGPRGATGVPPSVLTGILSNRSLLLCLLPTATEKRLAGVQGAAMSPLVAGTEAAQTRQDVRPRRTAGAPPRSKPPPAFATGRLHGLDLVLLGQGHILLPNGSPLQQRPHHPHQVMGGRHQGDLLALRVAALDPLEVRPDRRRAALRLPGGLGGGWAPCNRATMQSEKNGDAFHKQPPLTRECGGVRLPGG